MERSREKAQDSLLFQIKDNLDIFFHLFNQIVRQNTNSSCQPLVINRSDLINHNVTRFVHICGPFFKMNS